MLMVILGAGASYDSCASFPTHPDLRVTRGQLGPWHRPPLAQELFLPIAQFRQHAQAYPKCQPLVLDLEGHADIEARLEKFSAEATDDPERRRQLWAIQYYLRDVIAECQRNWLSHTYRLTNYTLLLDQIRRYPRILFVTFNYDSLLEFALDALLDVQYKTIADYAYRSNYNLMKLHGSIDWEYAVKAQTVELVGNETGPKNLIFAAPVIDKSAVIVKQGASMPNTMQHYFRLPALAIPTESKFSFVCPDEHVAKLRELIPQVEKILIVGWRAGEQHFLKELKAGLRKPVSVFAACGSNEASTATLEQLKESGLTPGHSRAHPSGFTDLVKSHALESFLAEPALPGPASRN